MKILKNIIFILCILSVSSQAHARFETHDFATPQMENDYNVLVQELRCLVCQNQNLADSNAELAQDMRLLVYKKLSEGKSKDEIVDFMIVRYGDFVMYRPPVKKATYILWYGPIIFFVVAGLVVVSYMRSQKKEVEKAVNKTQQKKAKSLLDD
ncbi:MAG: cytochrome c-type biogenesis protein CcmH [endosymbiont of Galathealinum brachiosum]|uniref:Cytochrome c-type biogenesis protein n=1 Tax=endosymbiont of Galathealinum brachiosum TaxID=2200906 RepID=A0A370D865_9GAMM|nr:MAG: cytochrome c-type biogenesis protein CcmH [endosymbiont of Galathealinum brachiosum]